jgi:DNA-binding transcriptional ArsR family regulator
VSTRERDKADEARLSLVFHGLADPARRKIVALLRDAGELTVGDIGAAFSMTQNGVSKHVKVLEAAGLVSRRVVGREHFISVRWSELQPAYAYLHAHQHFWTNRLDAFVDYAVNRDANDKRKK